MQKIDCFVLLFSVSYNKSKVYDNDISKARFKTPCMRQKCKKIIAEVHFYEINASVIPRNKSIMQGV
ncbi:MAG: hypothetical protein AXW14_10995 [Alteromonas sp. Nap_26]|nr:MAG: hypothetical protein AXW14_10995 [Alteromonas sp. Nap_26]